MCLEVRVNQWFLLVEARNEKKIPGASFRHLEIVQKPGSLIYLSFLAETSPPALYIQMLRV